MHMGMNKKLLIEAENTLTREKKDMGVYTWSQDECKHVLQLRKMLFWLWYI